MPTDFKVPDLGENVESGDIVNVLVHEGDEIQADQGVMEIETGKAVVELPCPIGGRVTKVHVHKGSKVKVGDPLLTVEGSNSSAAAPAKKEAPPTTSKGSPAKPEKQVVAKEPAADVDTDADEETAETATPKAVAKGTAAKSAAAKPKPTSKAKPAPSSAESPSESEKPALGKTPAAGPATRRLARELGIDLAQVSGSGPHGRITEDDVKASVREHAAAPRSTSPAAVLPEGTDDKDSWGAIRRQRMPAIRRAIAVNMARSAGTIPHVTNFDDADITELERIRKGGLADYVGTEIKLTMMAFVMKAAAQALKLHPLLNASVDMENEEIIYKQYVHIGVAVDTDRGLVVPVVRDV
ncbi:MAG TPA: 2-oxo acid dehydrogenase subunit E2, partial [Pirellulales bacterium]|nr:2-oxo acid dehydrogenase subunit E2 [Pirellulales bacterium]